MARSAPVARCQASTTEANASLISTRSIWSRVIPARRSACAVAAIGAVSIMTGSSPRALRWRIRARGRSPCARTAWSEATSTAAAASAIWLDSAAVIRPPSRSGANAAIFAAEVSLRGHSSVQISPYGTISASNAPAPMAPTARWWLASA